MKVKADDITKQGLVEKFTIELSKKDARIKELENELLLREREIKEKQKEISIYMTEDEEIKRVLELFAQGHQYSVILDKLRFSAINLSINEVKDICINIEKLSPELQLYYRQQVQAWEDSIKINPELLKDLLTRRYEFLYQEASIDLVNAVEVEERRRIRMEMKDHMKEMNNVLKNIVDDAKEVEENEFLSQIANKIMNNEDKKQDNYSKKESVEVYEVM